MTDDKTDAGPGRGDGEARGVSPLADEPRPPGEGWRKMWGIDAVRPSEPRQPVEMWHHEWRGIRLRCLDGLPEGGSVVGIWWRFIITGPIPGAEPVNLPSWATRPMIDSGPVKHRIVRAWHDGDGYLFVLGSDGRILSRENNTWRDIATYPPGLEP